MYQLRDPKNYIIRGKTWPHYFKKFDFQSNNCQIPKCSVLRIKCKISLARNQQFNVISF